MTSTEFPLTDGQEYVAFFHDGPFDGQTERRVIVDGTWEREVTMIAGQEGTETRLVYQATGARKVGSEVYVDYRWDQRDSDELTDPEERNDD